MNINPVIVGAVALAGAVLGLIIGWFGYRRIESKKLEASHVEAKDVLSTAKEKAKGLRKEAEIKAKEEQIRLREEAEKEIRSKKKEVRLLEKRIQGREASLEKKSINLDEREETLLGRQSGLEKQEAKIVKEEEKLNRVIAEMQERLESVAQLTATEAKEQLIESMVDEARKRSAKKVREVEDLAKAEADTKSKRILALAIQRYAGEHVAETTVTTVSIPDDQMKGRIIGREGRNIRAIEASTGCDLIIDDTPEAILIAGHNPMRRAVAKLSVEKLVRDGRIHPGRIETVVAQANKEIRNEIKDFGEKATLEAGAHGVHKELTRRLGALQYMELNSHNLLQHSVEVSAMAGLIAGELGLDEKIARRAGLLHDLGKGAEHDMAGTHAQIGAELLKRHGESKEVVAAVREHHDENPNTPYAVVLQAADSLSNARPGARRESMGAYIKRLADLEEVAVAFPGVTNAYAIQAGRELHVLVDHQIVNDDEAIVTARDIADKIENELSYPGQVHVTVIRESRSTHYAS